MKDFLLNIAELFNYAKTCKLSTITLKTPIIDFSFAPSSILQPSLEGCFFIPSLHEVIVPSHHPGD